jgi:hypothetical protein
MQVGSRQTKCRRSREERPSANTETASARYTHAPGMQDRELYRRILGIEAPWYVDSVELKLEEGSVAVQVSKEKPHRCQFELHTSLPPLRRARYEHGAIYDRR